MTKADAAEIDGDGYRLDVENFGPIVRASVDVRPLTVFVGPSNTGKSYLAILLYALHQCFGGPTARRWLLRHWRFGRPESLAAQPGASIRKSLKDWLSKGAGEKPPPADVAAYVRTCFERPVGVNRFLGDELRRCHGVDRLGDLVRRQAAKAGVSLHVSRNGERGGRYQFTLSRSEDQPSGSIAEIDSAAIDVRVRELLSDLARDWLEPDSLDGLDDFAGLFGAIMGRLFVNYFRPVFQDAYYLPADRTGVMHSHQVVVGALVQSATTAGLRPSGSIPMLSGVLADFLSQLIAMSEKRRRTRRRMEIDLAKRLEETILDGAVSLERSETGYPSFAYRPSGWKDDLPLMRTSSMVSELAPVVLYLRHVVSRGEVLIIEEPEAHLHPAMQAAFAREMARLVRAGIRVVMTTHSEWLLEQIGNLVRLSDVPESRRRDLAEADCALRPDQVGAWLFKRNRRPQGSIVEEVTIDAETGLYPTDYDDVSETLYNQSAEIFNRAQEGDGG